MLAANPCNGNTSPKIYSADSVGEIYDIRSAKKGDIVLVVTQSGFSIWRFYESYDPAEGAIEGVDYIAAHPCGWFVLSGQIGSGGDAGLFDATQYGALGDGETDDTEALLSVVAVANAVGGYVYLPRGEYRFSETLHFTESNTGIVGDGLNSILTWTGATSKNAIEFGTFTEFTADDSSDVITATGHPFSTATQVDVWTDFGTLPTGLSPRTSYYVGSISGATFKLYASSSDATTQTNPIDLTSAGSGVLRIGVRFGSSKEHIRFESFTLRPDFTQTLDAQNRPTDWFLGKGMVIRGARNCSMFKNMLIQAFLYGLHVRAGWMSRYEANRLQNTKYGATFEEESNNSSFEGNMFRRCGDVNNLTDGWAMNVIASYAFTNKDADLETCNCYGFIYEQCHAFTHIGGNIEANDLTLRKIVLKGRQSSPDFANNPDDWTHGFSIIDVRFHRSLGIEIQNGVQSFLITGCTFRLNSGATTTTAIRTSGATTFVRNLQLGPNDYHGDNDTYYPVELAAFRFIEKNTRAIQVITSPPLDITDANGYAIGYINEAFEVVKIQILEDVEASTAGVTSLTVDIGVGASMGTIASNLAWSPSGVALSVSPYGIAEYTSGFTANQVAGVLRARIEDLVGGTGSIKVRVFYRMR